MNEAEYKAQLTRYWLEKAHESLASAESETEALRLGFAVNRLYYAAFYAVTAVLALEGKKLTKHSAVRAALHRDYVRTGKIDQSLGRLYDELFHARQQSDYMPMVEFDESVVRQQMEETRRFLAWCKAYVANLDEGR